MEKLGRKALFHQMNGTRTAHLYILEAVIAELWLELLLLSIEDVYVSLEFLVRCRRVVTSYVSHLQTAVISFHFAMLKRYLCARRPLYMQPAEA